MNQTTMMVVQFALGVLVGLLLPSASTAALHLWRKWRAGVCFRYLPGPRELRDGTESNFCLRCGKPGGYHR